MEKEKPLEDLTVKELKEMALALGSITGVSAMKKTDLIRAIKEAKGIPAEEVREKPVGTIVEMKHRIKELRAARETLRDQGEKKKIRLLRKKISGLKKRTRRLAKRTA
jgi:hypothetical protein